MEEKEMLFSILVPVFNTEKYLSRCIDSVLQQTCPDFEIVIVNDGSTDRSPEICEAYATKEPRVRYHSQENRGLLMTRRKGIALARGRYCLFLDSDDWFRRDALSHLAELIRAHDPDVVAFNHCVAGNGETVQKPLYDRPVFFDGDSMKDLQNIFIRTNDLNNLCFKAIRRSIFRSDIDYGKFRHKVSHGEDTLQSIHVFKVAKTLMYTPEALYYYFKNPESITAVSDLKRLDDCNVIFLEKERFISEIFGKQSEQYRININRYVHRLLSTTLILTYDRKIRPANYQEVFSAIRRMECVSVFENYPDRRGISLESRIFLSLLLRRKYRLLYALVYAYGEIKRLLGGM